MVTSNHIHLLVKDTGPNVIAQSMQLIAGRTAQEYNQRRATQGAFWEDRYHATAIENDEHLHRCLIYIDLNMIRAGVVNHPGQWAHSGYQEIHKPPERYAIIDLSGLAALCGFTGREDFQQAHCQWVEEALACGPMVQDDRWSEAIAVGGLPFVEKIKSELGEKGAHRDVVQWNETYALREPSEAYRSEFASETGMLRLENTILWEKSAEPSET